MTQEIFDNPELSNLNPKLPRVVLWVTSCVATGGYLKFDLFYINFSDFRLDIVSHYQSIKIIHLA